MTKLKYTLKTDTLFKMLFTKYQNLLKRLVAELLDIKYDNIEQFNVINPDITPEELGKKFCRLDINMTVNGQKIDLEVQVTDEGNYPERSLFYWAREFSTGINEGDDYSLLPRTIVISILGFNQFKDPQKFHSEFRCLEVTSHEPLTDKQVLHFYELKKLPPLDRADSGRDLWLKLFNAETEEELTKIEEMGVPIMTETLQAYRHVAASDEFIQIERMRSKARHDEAQAIGNAERRGEERANIKWQSVLADKDALIAELQAKLENL
ncbi:MAG: Rpn family recombination-promoting nuclease/putative transposase [Defluviitaleaceae bacterium]|nr:Rpn family recombination-promoting nuclease/putative transposase [Defluviitaleaceae bacterium]